MHCVRVCVHVRVLTLLGLSSVHSEAAQKTETSASWGRTGVSHSPLSLAAFPLASLM